jgi:hypothetical protein
MEDELIALTGGNSAAGTWLPEDQLTQRTSGAISARCNLVILPGHAASVPFTAVMTGPQRTATDNATAHSTSALPSLRSERHWIRHRGPTMPRIPRSRLQKLALSGDSAEAIQPKELQENRPSVSPERASLCRLSGGT